MESPKVEPLPGFLLVFTAQEHASIKKALEAWGYSSDSEGLKEFVLDEVCGENEHQKNVSLGSMLGDAVLSHPELIDMGSMALKGLFKKLRTR